MDVWLRQKYAGIQLVYRARMNYSSDDPALWAEMKEKADCFIYFAAPSCSTTACAITWPARRIERMGIPGLTVLYRYLEKDALISREREGMQIRFAETEFPCTNISDEDLNKLIRDIEDALLAPLKPEELVGGIYTPPQPPRFCAEGTEDELQEYFQENGLTDGLPVIIPTEERVAEMLKGTSHAPDEIVATQMAPEGRIVSVEKAAITAVMAGAKPEYMPVILAMIELMGTDPRHHQTAKSTNYQTIKIMQDCVHNDFRHVPQSCPQNLQRFSVPELVLVNCRATRDFLSIGCNLALVQNLIANGIDMDILDVNRESEMLFQAPQQGTFQKRKDKV